MTKRFPSKHENRAVEAGADELMARLEWELQDRPRALRNARARYRECCAALLAQIERTSPQRSARWKQVA